MKTITVNLYEYDELGEKAKEKALEQLADINVDYPGWYDGDYWRTIETLKDAGIEVDMRGVSFDLGRSDYLYFSPFRYERDGVKGEHAGIWIEDAGKLARTLVKLGALPRKFVKLAEDGAIYFQIDTRHYGGGDARNILNVYASAEPGYTAVDALTEEQYDKAQKFLDDLLSELKGDLRKEYEYQTDKEQVEETIRANGYHFTEDGKLA